VNQPSIYAWKSGVKQHWLTPHMPHSRKWGGAIDPLWPCASAVYAVLFKITITVIKKTASETAWKVMLMIAPVWQSMLSTRGPWAESHSNSTPLGCTCIIQLNYTTTSSCSSRAFSYSIPNHYHHHHWLIAWCDWQPNCTQAASSASSIHAVAQSDGIN